MNIASGHLIEPSSSEKEAWPEESRLCYLRPNGLLAELIFLRVTVQVKPLACPMNSPASHTQFNSYP